MGRIRLFITSNKWTSIGVGGVLLSFLAATMLYSSAILPKGRTADTLLHLDYAWQVSHGDLPQFWQGPEAPIETRIPSVQFVSQHPPLFYVILAPFVGPSIDSGEWIRAVKIARLVNTLLGVLTVLALAWGGWVFGGKYKKVLAIATAAIGASMMQFIRVSGDIFNDTIAITFSTLALTLAALIIKDGPKRNYLIASGVVSLLGMSSRASFISSFGLLLVSIVVGHLIHIKKHKIRKSALSLIMIIMFVLIGIGWFYNRNHNLSGDWHRSAPKSWITKFSNRQYKTLSQVVTSPNLWTMLPERMYGSTFAPKVVRTEIPKLILIISLAGILFGYRNNLKDIVRRKNLHQLWLPGLLAVQVVLVYGEQVVHAVGYGAFSFRYILPALLPISIFMGAGLLAWSKRGWLVMVSVILAYTMVLFNIAYYLEKKNILSGQEGLLRIVKVSAQYFGGFRAGYEGTQDWDLFLRISRQTNKIMHIPKVLYSWRKSANSTAQAPSSKNYAYINQKKALMDDVKQRGYDADISWQIPFSMWKVRYKVKNNPMVSIIIPTKDQYAYIQRCLESINQNPGYKNTEVIIADTGSSDPKVWELYDEYKKLIPKCRVIKWTKQFNFASVCNFGAKEAKGDYLLFLNNDTEVITPTWVEDMLGYAQQQDIGAVGCKLLYPDGKLQHGGIILGVGGMDGTPGIAGHYYPAFAVNPPQDPAMLTYVGGTRDFTAVTAACVMVSASKFNKVKGFDDKYRIAFNDVDMCLKLFDKGWRNVYLSHVELYHHESVSVGQPGSKVRDLSEFDKEIKMMLKRWRSLIENDPYYHPEFRRDIASARLKV